jgi:hypothetical protein
MGFPWSKLYSAKMAELRSSLVMRMEHEESILEAENAIDSFQLGDLVH